MEYVDLSKVQEASSGGRIPAGGYICRLISVEDVPDKKYLKIEFDIAEGEHAGHYLRLFQNFKFWGGRYVRSYKDAALPFFKRFITSIEASNRGFKFDGRNEAALKGKLVGLIIGHEEYKSQSGEIKTREYVDMERSADTIRDGEFDIPEFKKLNGGDRAAKLPPGDPPPGYYADAALDDEDLPF